MYFSFQNINFDTQFVPWHNTYYAYSILMDPNPIRTALSVCNHLVSKRVSKSTNKSLNRMLFIVDRITIHEMQRASSRREIVVISYSSIFQETCSKVAFDLHRSIPLDRTSLVWEESYDYLLSCDEKCIVSAYRKINKCLLFPHTYERTF